MASTAPKSKNSLKMAALAASLAVLAVIGGLVIRDMLPRRPDARRTDAPPEIEFTWTPRRALTLNEFKGSLSLKDDHALDFSTYKFRIVELDKTIGLPIEGLVGKEYTSDIYLSLLANDYRVMNSDQLTFEISISDDRGQNTAITRVVRLKRSPLKIELKAE